MKSFQEFYRKYWSKGIGMWSPRNLGLSLAEQTLVKCYVQQGCHVLDIGCGDARYADFLSSLGCSSYVGLDISESAVKLCIKRGLTALVHDVGEPLPFDEGSFDIILVFEVLEHLFRPDLCLVEIHRVLRKDGYIIGSVPNVAFITNRILMLMGNFNPGGSPPTSLKSPWKDPHLRFFTKATLNKLLKLVVDFAEVKIIGEKFSLTTFPVLYKLNMNLRHILDLFSLPFGFLGRYFPSIFASRLFFIARKD